MRARRAWLLVLVLVLGVLPCAAATQAAPRVHALVIGNNAPLVGAARGSAESQPLRFADDDAVAFHELVAQVAASTHLLAVLDGPTQRLYPHRVAEARVPTLGELERAVDEVAERLAEDRRAGFRSAVFFFFSGHGSVHSEDAGEAALALFDAALSQRLLYERVLARLPADVVHVLVDACHAEAVVRPRDGQAEIVSVTPEQANAFLVRGTLRRFPNVGAILAASASAASHEWDALGHGIFTYELLSALRGAADVNRDRRVEYSEVMAFMSAANREIADPRARLSVVAKPPEVDRRAPLLTLSTLPRHHNSWLAGVPGLSHKLELEDEHGRKLLTFHGAADYVTDLVVPAGATVFVRRAGEEARFRAPAGGVTPFESLVFAAGGARSRGALGEAMRRGLFSARFGRSYYQGFVDRSEGFSSVDFVDSGAAALFDEDAAAGARARLVVLGGMSNSVARSLHVSHGGRVGIRPTGTSGPMAHLDVLTVGDGRLREWRVGGSAGYLWSIRRGPVQGWAGGSVGGAWLAQAVDGADARATPAALAGPVVGLSARLGRRVGMWSELDVMGLVHQRDSELRVSFAPSAWLGAAVGF